MIKLENITKGKYCLGVMLNQTLEVIDAAWHVTDVIEITFKDAFSNPYNEILYRDSEVNLEIVHTSAPWSFNTSSNLFKLVLEA